MNIAHFQALLNIRRDNLLADAAAAAGASDTVELDQTRQGRLSRMDAMQQQAMAAETHRRRSVELQRIAAALGRIDQDEYGYCVQCDEQIGAGRLEIDPAATLCIRCAELVDP
ncbi:MAG: TraR/DksA C4-type zinc finger protein [Thiohalocapsa sp.]